MFGGSTNEEAPDCVYKARSIQRFNHFKLNTSRTHAGEYHCPPLAVDGATSCPMRGNRPGPKHIQADIGESGERHKTISREVGHLLYLCRAAWSSACDAVVNGSTYAPLTDN